MNFIEEKRAGKIKESKFQTLLLQLARTPDKLFGKAFGQCRRLSVTILSRSSSRIGDIDRPLSEIVTRKVF